RLVVILADGVEKYQNALGPFVEEKRYELTVDEARSNPQNYGTVIWTNTAFAPRTEGIQLIASSLGLEPDKVRIARAQDVQTLISTEKIPEALKTLYPDGTKVILGSMVC